MVSNIPSISGEMVAVAGGVGGAVGGGRVCTGAGFADGRFQALPGAGETVSGPVVARRSRSVPPC